MRDEGDIRAIMEAYQFLAPTSADNVCRAVAAALHFALLDDPTDISDTGIREFLVGIETALEDVKKIKLVV